MFRAQGFSQMASDRLYQRFGLGVFALTFVQASQIVQADGDIGMVGAQGLFPNCQRPLV